MTKTPQMVYTTNGDKKGQGQAKQPDRPKITPKPVKPEAGLFFF